MLNYFPKYFTSKAIYLYIGALLVVSFVFRSYTMHWYWYIIGLIATCGFFYFSNTLTRNWSCITSKSFTKKLFTTALTIRIIWVVFSYFFYIAMTGQPFEFSSADATFYDQMGKFGHRLITEGNFNFLSEFDRHGGKVAVSDCGYPIYLSFIYFLTGNSIFIARIIKALLSAFTIILIYRLSVRNFGEGIGRIVAIFCVLMPNFIYYCGLHLKETEMLFLIVAFIERADHAMRNPKFSFLNFVLPVLLAASLFFFRTVLGATALFAFVTALIFSSTRAIKKGGRRLMLIVWVAVVVTYFIGGRIATEVEEVWEARNDNQQTSMEWRAERKDGNQFAKYASGAVFAPLILVIPFPTIVNVEIQQNQQMIHGGNYVKNILAFFAMFSLLWFIKSGKWRDHLLLISFPLGYLIVIALSAFAHSERFHLPALPFLLILAAVGVSQQTNKSKKYYIWYLTFIFVAIVGWSWYKLAGRGMV